LQQVLSAPTTPKLSWAKDINGSRYVKALVVANSADPDLVALRADVLAKGGSVYLRYVSVAALSVHAAGQPGGGDRRAQRRAGHLAEPADRAHRQRWNTPPAR
jgi:hypothetical protein